MQAALQAVYISSLSIALCLTQRTENNSCGYRLERTGTEVGSRWAMLEGKKNKKKQKISYCCSWKALIADIPDVPSRCSAKL